jgi:hypothetical protein
VDQLGAADAAAISRSIDTPAARPARAPRRRAPPTDGRRGTGPGSARGGAPAVDGQLDQLGAARARGTRRGRRRRRRPPAGTRASAARRARLTHRAGPDARPLRDDDDPGLGDVKRSRSSSRSTPISAPGSMNTSLSTIALRTIAPAPTSTPENRTESSTSARECRCTRGEITERRTVAPETITPGQTIESSACPCGRPRRTRTWPAAAARAASGSATPCCRG